MACGSLSRTNSTSRCSHLPYHTADCYVRPGEYLHHMYIDGIKYVVAPAVMDGPRRGRGGRGPGGDRPPAACTSSTTRRLLADAERYGNLDGVTLLGDPPPTDEESAPTVSEPVHAPRAGARGKTSGSTSRSSSTSSCARSSPAGQMHGRRLGRRTGRPVRRPEPDPPVDAKQTLIDIVGQRRQRATPASSTRSSRRRGPPPSQEAMSQDELRRPRPGAVRRLRRRRARPDGQEDRS